MHGNHCSELVYSLFLKLWETILVTILMIASEVTASTAEILCDVHIPYVKENWEKTRFSAAEATVMSIPRGMPVCMGWHGKAHT